MVELQIPPLRERLEDLPQFIEFFAQKFAKQYNCPVWRPDRQTLRTFFEYPWPGNIRQLSNIIEQSYVLCCAPELPATALESTVPTLPFLDLTKLCDEA